MQYFTIAAALSALMAMTSAAPVISGETEYQWSVSKWQYSRGEDSYDYSFSVTGPQDGKTPGFTATCSGAAMSGFNECTILPEATGHAAIPTILAKVKNVVDPENPNDTVPRVFVRETYTNRNDCVFTQTGNYIKRGFNQPTGSGKGAKFAIVPASATAVC